MAKKPKERLFTLAEVDVEVAAAVASSLKEAAHEAEIDGVSDRVRRERNRRLRLSIESLKAIPPPLKLVMGAAIEKRPGQSDLMHQTIIFVDALRELGAYAETHINAEDDDVE